MGIISYRTNNEQWNEIARSVRRLATGWTARSGDRILEWARFFAPVCSGPGAHPDPCTMGNGTLPGGKAAEAWC